MSLSADAALAISNVAQPRVTMAAALVSALHGLEENCDDHQGDAVVCSGLARRREVASIGLDASKFGTHSLRRTKAVLIYRRTGNLQDVFGITRRRYLIADMSRSYRTHRPFRLCNHNEISRVSAYGPEPPCRTLRPTRCANS